MPLSEKRSASPSLISSDHKKLKTSSSTEDKTDPSPEPEPSRAPTRITRGTEWFSLSGTDRDTPSINAIIVRTTQELARQGKRLVHAPKLFSDGICFDWLLDYSSKDEDVKDLMNVEGVSQTALQTLLRKTRGEARRSPSARSESNGTFTEASLVIHLLSDDETESQTLAASKVAQAGLDASNPICIDTDEEQDLPVVPFAKSAIHDEEIKRPRRASYGPGFDEGRAYDGESHDDIVPQSRTSGALVDIGSECDQNDMEFDSNMEPSTSTSASGHEIVSEIGTNYTERSVASRAARRSSKSNYPVDWQAHSMSVRRSSASSASGSSASGECLRASSAVPEAAVVHTRMVSRQLTDRPDVVSLYDESNMLATSSDSDADDDDDVEDVEESAAEVSSSNRGTPVLAPRTSTSQQAPSPNALRSAHPRSRSFSPESRFAGSSKKSVVRGASVNTPRPASDIPLPRRTIPTRSRVVHRRAKSNPSSDDDEEEDLLGSIESQRLGLSSRNDPHVGCAAGWEQSGSEGLSVNIPKTNFARGRRLLVPSDNHLPYTTVAMRGDAQFIRKDQLNRISSYSLPPSPDPSGDPNHHVEDCCLVAGSTVVVGYNSRPCQVSLIPLAADQRPKRINLTHRAHHTVQENPHSAVSQLNPGIRCLAPVEGPRLRFLSGGHDKTVHLWTLTHNGGNYTARSEQLNISHSHSVHALAYRAYDETILSCAGACVSTTRLSEHRGHDPSQVSGSILQVHVHPQAPHLIILEVKHMDRQVQLYDTRKANFTRAPCLEFGYRDTSTRQSTTRSTTSRYTRGSPCMSFFGRGYSDGTVRIWDYRKPDNVLTRFQCQRPAPVVHTVFSDSGSTVIAYGGHSVTFWDVNGGA